MEVRRRVSAVDRFLAAAAELGVPAHIRRFPSGTRTAEDAAAAVGCELGQIVKSLVFAAADRPFLALTSGTNRVDSTRLGELLEAMPVRRATPDEAREATGFAIGGTPPFGHAQELLVLVDRDLMGYAELWAAAGAPDAVFAITPADLLRATGGEVADFKEEGRSGR